jgi:hypothetical protein
MRIGILICARRDYSVLILTPIHRSGFGKVGVKIAQNVNRETHDMRRVPTTTFIYCGCDDRTNDRAVARLRQPSSGVVHRPRDPTRFRMPCQAILQVSSFIISVLRLTASSVSTH